MSEIVIFAVCFQLKDVRANCLCASLLRTQFMSQRHATSCTSARANDEIAQFRYLKIQLETKDITTRLREINHINLLHYSPKPRSDVFCFKLNFNISKLGYLLT